MPFNYPYDYATAYAQFNSAPPKPAAPAAPSLPGQVCMIPLPKTAKEMLALLDNFPASIGDNPDHANLPGSESRKLWAILTALRGPDDDDEVVKSRTTSIIRARVLPHLSRAAGAFVNMSDPLPNPSDVNTPSTHFNNHIGTALSAIARL